MSTLTTTTTSRAVEAFRGLKRLVSYLARFERKVPICQSRLADRSPRERNRLLMLDVDTFLTKLYVIADDFCQSRQREARPTALPLRRAR